MENGKISDVMSVRNPALPDIQTREDGSVSDAQRSKTEKEIKNFQSKITLSTSLSEKELSVLGLNDWFWQSLIDEGFL